MPVFISIFKNHLKNERERGKKHTHIQTAQINVLICTLQFVCYIYNKYNIDTAHFVLAYYGFGMAVTVVIIIVRLIELHSSNWNIYYGIFLCVLWLLLPPMSILLLLLLLCALVCLHFMSICSFFI